MSSPSSTHNLKDIDPGTRVFIDANIFIYHFTTSLFTAICTSFLERIETNELHGVTSSVILAEVSHRLMVLEAIDRFQFPSKTTVKKLKEKPDLVKQLSKYVSAANKISDFNVHIEPVAFNHLIIGQQLSAQHGLLTNDSLTAALMHSLGLTNIATNNTDLERLPNITIWKP
ncbi:MAG: type II toxin-antitoxin system VapC family toxin [Acidobacteria bacterium]|nr:type II toxin-antitoxin system VapC family toxin [Acidobacteriota bacterium]MBI3658055.1 type II toxin-antitoxin system VapC family toxin [Acidobacteriota bacterium]